MVSWTDSQMTLLVFKKATVTGQVKNIKSEDMNLLISDFPQIKKIFPQIQMLKMQNSSLLTAFLKEKRVTHHYL